MATKKPATPVDEKFEKQDFDLFEALAALDKKDYGYIDKLTEEQQKKFVPYMMTHWMSAIKGANDIQGYYLMSTEYHANKYLFNEVVQKHPKLQWQMLCASSPGLGKQFHQWIPHLSSKIAQLKETPKTKEINEIVFVLNPSVEGEATGMYLSRLLRPIGIKVSQVAYGIPFGGTIEFTDRQTLGKALENLRCFL